MDGETQTPPEPPTSSFVERIAKEYPDQYQFLRELSGRFADNLRVFEQHVNNISGLEAAMTPEQADAAYDTLAQEFTDFIVTANRERIEAAESRQYHDVTTGSITVTADSIKQDAMHYALDNGNSLRILLDTFKGGTKPDAGGLWLCELYNQPTVPDIHQKFLKLPPNERAVRGVGLGIAAWMMKGLGSDTLTMFKTAMEKSNVSTPLGNPIDVAKNMVQKAGFPPRSV